jgi:hypothetical protein
MLAKATGFVELVMGGGKAIFVFPSVFIAQKSYIDITGAHFFEIDSVGTTIGCRKIFEEENIEEPAQQGITLEVGFERLPFNLHLFLHGTDEYL